LLKIVKTNFVVVSVLCKGHKRDNEVTLSSNMSVVFSGHRHPSVAAPMVFEHVITVATYLENLEKSGNSTLIRGKSGKLWFACDVLPQL